MQFEESFKFGVATAALQIEGAANEDGKGKSVWDIFCKQPGKVFGGHTVDVACDHYHLYKEDVAMMKEMGIKHYRFSISWPRVIPNGVGEVNEKGLQFYDNLVDELLAAGIEPYITLFHWDLPYELHKKGGWMNDESPLWFKAYAKVIAERFSDRVKNFMTFNEPQCFVGMSCAAGIHAPGHKHAIADTATMAHHVLLAHGHAVMALREHAKQPLQIGFVTTGSMHYPVAETPEHIEAARRAIFDVTDMQPETWLWNVSWWNDPIYLGSYPEDGVKLLGDNMPNIKPGDMEIISQPLDFIGLNIYNGVEIEAGEDGSPVYREREVGYAKTALSWPITPKALYWGPRFCYERYNQPIYITENGLSCHDTVSLDGKVYDPNRIDFLARYLLELGRAVEDGIPVEGYFQWSLMDNFEWHSGYADRFGLIYVNYETQERIWKDSAYWYKNLIETRTL